MRRTVSRTTKERAKELRRNLTHAEKRLWSRLRGKRFLGLHVRKQHPIGPYIVDFLVPKLNMVIELDGDSHDVRLDKDKKRDDSMQEQGLEVVRIQNRDVMANLDGVIEYLRSICEQRMSTPS